MTFAEIVDEVLTRCNLSSTEATTRVENSVNRHYARVTSLCGMETSRYVTRSAAMTVGVKTVTFTSIEKIDRIIDVSVIASPRPIDESSIQEIRTTTPGTSAPGKWATQNVLGTSVTILTDTIPDAAYSLQADGVTTLSELADDDIPAFPASFHDILTFYVLDEELLRKEKADLADRYKAKADELLQRLQFHLADSPTQITRQGETPSGVGSGSAGGGGSDADYAVLAEDETVTGRWGFIQDIVLGGSFDNQIVSGTANAADVMSLAVCGGGDSDLARGGRLIVAGNEHGTLPGLAAIQAGNVAGSKVAMSRGDGGHAIEIAGATGLVTFNYGQLAFPATQNASTGVNTLDDYEEGSWTPTVTGSGGSSGQVYSAQAGRYVKIGRHVTLWGRVTLSTLGTITTSVQIDGFPFTAHSVVNSGGSIGYFAAMTATFGSLSMLVQTSTTKATLYGLKVPATGMTALVQGDLSATSDIIFTVTYEAAA